MAKLTLHITGNVDDVKNKIKIIHAELSNIEKKPVKIGVQAEGLDAIASKLKEISEDNIKAANAAARLANAQAKKMAEERKATAATQELAKATKEQAQATQSAAQASEEAAISNKQLSQSFIDAEKRADFLKVKGKEIYATYMRLAEEAQRAQQGTRQLSVSNEQLSQSFGAAERQANYLRVQAENIYNTFRLMGQSAQNSAAQIRELGAAYRELAIALNSTSHAPGGNGAAVTQGTTNAGGQRLLGSGVNWRYWEPTVTYEDGDGGFRIVEEGANAAANAVNETSRAFNTLRDGMSAAWQKMNEGTPIADALGDSIGNIIVKITTWQVVNGIVANIKRAFKDALDTMKAVDQELTNIAKVSDLSAEEIQKIGDSAYDVASKYGVAADEYLKAVYTFQKAGLGDSAEKMAELATKTMLVGDTTAEVATRFIISANAAWKFGGSVEALNKIVDEADKLNNEYAVSLEDIATGLPIVGATAAQVGMTAEQTMAAISTIVASTGQSASKAATALRAIIMNLIGETGELDDGLVVTEDTIKSLNTVLNVYAKDAMAAAEATGTIVDPMEAIAALAQAAEEGFLNQAELFEVLSGLGGKLRTTQLTALVNNMEMYNSMLKDTADAAGTADREISVMLESWNAKTQILTNTFTQFISHLVDSKGIKTGIDFLTRLVKVLDSGAGKFAALTIAVLGVTKAFTMLATTGIGATLVSLASGFITVSEAVNVLTASILSSPLFWAAAIAGVIYGISAAVDALTTSYEEQKAILDEIQSNYDSLYGVGSEYDNLKNKVEDLTDAEKELLAVLELEAQAERDKLNAAKEATFLEWRKDRAGAGTTTTMNPAQGSQFAFKIETTDLNAQQVKETSAALSELVDLYEAGNYTTEGYKEKVQELALALNDSAEEIKRGKEAGVELTDSEQELLDLYTKMVGILAGLTGKTKENTDAMNDNAASTEDAGDAVSDLVDDLLSLQDELEGATKAIEAFNEATKAEKGDALKDYADVYKKFLEDWKEGLQGSNTVKAAIEAILGPDAIIAAAGDWKALGEMLASDFWKGVFADEGKDYGANFMNALADIMDANGNIIDSNGKVVASFAEAGDALTLTGYDVEGLAKMLGTTPDVIMAMVDAWDIWSGSLILSKDEIMNLATELDAITRTGFIDVTKFLEGLASDGEHSAAQILDIYNALRQMDGVKLANLPQDIGDIISKADEAKDSADDAKTALDELGDTEATPTLEVDTTAFDRTITTVKRTLDELSRTPTVISIITKTTKASAGGTDSAAGGETLVNEEGPELIQEGDTARIAGGGQPTITDVAPGARIFTAEETKKILAGRSTFGKIRAADGGITPATGPRYNETSIPAGAPGEEEPTLSLDDLKAKVALLKQELAFLQESGAAAEEIEAKQREIQATLHTQAEELRKSEEYQKGDAKAVADVVALSTEWWKIQNDITDAEEKRRQAEQKALEEQQKALEEQQKALEEQQKAIEEAQKKELEGKKDVVSLRKQELEYLKESGASEAEIEAKQREIQGALKEQRDYLESINGSKEEILKIDTEILSITNDIADAEQRRAEEAAKALEEERKRAEEALEAELKAELQARKDAVSLLQKELSYLKASGASEDEQIEKMRQIQAAIRYQLEYMESIGASQEDIVSLATEWWNVENDILSIQDKLAQQLRNEIADVLSMIVDSLQSAAGEMTSPLQQQLDSMKSQKDVEKDLREEEEKRLAVQEKELALQKAKIALENAQKERTVRQYNSKTGQWEWVADARNVEAAQKNVETAQKNLIDAQTNLADYLAEKEYEAARAKIERQIGYTTSAFDALKDAIEDVIKAIKNGEMSYKDAYSYIKKKLKEIYDKYGIDLTGKLGDIIANLDGVDEDFVSLLQSLSSVKGGYESLAEILDSVPGEFQDSVMKSLAAIFAQDLTNDAKGQILADIHAIFGNEKLSAEAKTKILSGIKVIFENDALKTETKQNIVSAISALVGTSDDAESAVGLFTEFIATAIEKADNPEDAINTLVGRIKTGAERFGDIDALLQNVNDDTNRLLLIAQMRLNSAKWWMLPRGSEEQKALEQQNQEIGNALGWSYDAASGYWYDENGNLAYEPDKSGAGLSGENGTDLIGNIDSNVDQSVKLLGDIKIGIDAVKTAINNLNTGGSRGGGGSSVSVDSKVTSETIKGKAGGSSSGSKGAQSISESVANSINGIKERLGGSSGSESSAVTSSIASKITKFSNNTSALSANGIVTSSRNSVTSTVSPTGNTKNVGSQHNGDNYYIDGISLQNVTSKTTLGELTAHAKKLSLVKGS